MSLSTAEQVVLLRKRDGDNCYICGLRMNFTLPRGHRRAPSIEHVIPRAAGGSNRLDNKKLAHYWPCNARKGAWHEGVNYATGDSPEKRIAELEEQTAQEDLERLYLPKAANE